MMDNILLAMCRHQHGREQKKINERNVSWVLLLSGTYVYVKGHMYAILLDFESLFGKHKNQF